MVPRVPVAVCKWPRLCEHQIIQRRPTNDSPKPTPLQMTVAQPWWWRYVNSFGVGFTGHRSRHRSEYVTAKHTHCSWQHCRQDTKAATVLTPVLPCSDRVFARLALTECSTMCRRIRSLSLHCDLLCTSLRLRLSVQLLLLHHLLIEHAPILHSCQHSCEPLLRMTIRNRHVSNEGSASNGFTIFTIFRSFRNAGLPKI